MEAYTAFAEVYDAFMDNIPYGEWADYVQSLLTEYGVRDGLVLELGCGTGNLTELLASMGYDMIGVDCSGDMLGEWQLVIAFECRLLHSPIPPRSHLTFSDLSVTIV